MVDRVGQRVISVEDVHQEDAATLEEGAGDPNGEGDGDDDLGQVGVDGRVH